MEPVARLLLFIAFLFAGFFVLNLYFRVKVVGSYRRLSKARIEFGASEIFSDEKMQVIIDRHPDHEADLKQFSRYLRLSVWMASVFIVVTIVFGSILLYFR